MDHYAKIILFSDCVSRELSVREDIKLVILICTMAMQLFGLKFFFLNTHVYQS